VATAKYDSEPEVVFDAPCETGEGPLWHEDEGALYWVDIPAGRVYRYDPASGRNEVAYQHDEMVGGFTIQADGSLLLFCSRGGVLHLRDGAVTPVIAEIPAEREGRLNDVIADPEGRVFCGTMPSPKGLARLYRLDPDGTLTEVFGDIGLSNGMGFSPDLRTFYHTDTNHRCIYRMDYDRATGEVSNRSVLLRTPPNEGAPDGMAVAADGTIWSARWNGRALFHYDAEGDLLGRVPFPVKKVSSVAFGGDDYAIAYVTTACGEGGSRSDEEGHHAGSLFRVDLGARGTPPFRSRVGL
jgi:sugar lactone lactonase YvrE